MTDPVYVFCYDIERDRDRTKVADLLSNHLVRVQKSVFEGRMAREDAYRLARKVVRRLGLSDSLRVYCIEVGGLEKSFAFGPQPLPEQHDFYLV